MDPRTPSIFTRGAVDLGSLRPVSAQQPAQQPTQKPPTQKPPPSSASSPAPSNGGVARVAASDVAASDVAAGGVAVIDVTEATFQTEVLERSLTTPVVIDFWAEWCGPCKQLSPVLEKLAVEGGGSWVLAKVDVDANPRLAQMFRVQGIPMVYAVVGGQPVDAFTGVMPEAQLREWLGAILKAGGVPLEEPGDPHLDAADDALMSGDLDAAEQAYKKILGEKPNDMVAEAGLAQVGLLRRVEGVDPRAALDAAAAAPDDLEAQTRAADVEVLSGRAEDGYGRLVDFIRRSSGEDKEAARRHLVSLFTVAGPDDPAVAAARRRLATALF